MSWFNEIFEGIKMAPAGDQKSSGGGSVPKKEILQGSIALEPNQLWQSADDKSRVKIINVGEKNAICGIDETGKTIEGSEILFISSAALETHLSTEGFTLIKPADNTGNATLSNEKINEDAAVLQETIPAQVKKEPVENLVRTVVPEQSAQARAGNPIKERSQEQTADKGERTAEQTTEITPHRGDIFENETGERLTVERVKKEDNGMTVYYTEALADGTLKNDKKMARKLLQNFRVLVDFQGMKQIDPIKVEYPEFYERYEEQMGKVSRAFKRELQMMSALLDNWAETLKKGDGDNIKLCDQLYVKIETLGNAWNKLKDYFVKQGKQRMRLFEKLRALEGKMPENTREAVQRFKKEYADDEPQTATIQEEYQRISFEQTTKQLNERARRLQEKYDSAYVGKDFSFTADALAGQDFEKRVNALIASITEKSSPDQKEAVFEALDELEGQMFEEKRTHDTGNGKKGKKRRNGEESGGFIRGKKRMMPRDEGETAVTGDRKTEMRIRPSRELVVAFENAVEAAQTGIVEQIGGAESLAVLKTIGTLEKRYDPKKKREYSVREFLHETQDSLKQTAEKLIGTVAEGGAAALLKTANAYIFSVWKVRAAALLKREQEQGAKGQESAGTSGKKTAGKKRNEAGEGESTKMGRARNSAKTRKTVGAKKEGGEKTVFESLVPEGEQAEIIERMKGFITSGLQLIDAALKKAGKEGLNQLLRSQEPEDKKRAQLFLQRGIGENVVKIAEAYGGKMKGEFISRTTAAIEEKGKALLLEAMRKRLLPDKTE